MLKYRYVVNLSFLSFIWAYFDNESKLAENPVGVLRFMIFFTFF